MYYANSTTYQVVTIDDIRTLHPNVSIPNGGDCEVLGFIKLALSPKPAYNAITQGVRPAQPVYINGILSQAWEVYPLPAGDVVANIAAAKQQAWDRIKAERDQRKNGGVLVSGKWFHTDVDSRIQQLGLVLMGAGVPSVNWKTLDGSFTTMSQALAGGIFQAVATLDMALFSVAESHRAAMEASDNPDAYDFSTGWPAHFTE
jgi:hypothetical protein